jgi:hypothetical protein
MSFSGDVSVTAYVANGSGGAPAIDNAAYLTSWPLPNLSDIVASTDFTLPGLYFGTFTLFSISHPPSRFRLTLATTFQVAELPFRNRPHLIAVSVGRVKGLRGRSGLPYGR